MTARKVRLGLFGPALLLMQDAEVDHRPPTLGRAVRVVGSLPPQFLRVVELPAEVGVVGEVQAVLC